ncbi:MAG: FAD/NAD(P)-binding domain-containing protein [Aureliella sp.]
MSLDVGIIGCGPRGLRVLEELLSTQENHSSGDASRISSITIWEPSNSPGAGVNYSDDCEPTCLLNVPCRDLDLDGRPATKLHSGTIPAFSSWREWLQDQALDCPQDVFPPRGQLGTYLNERFRSLLDNCPSEIRLKVLPSRVDECNLAGSQWQIVAGGTETSVDVLHVCIGHQPPKPLDLQVELQEHLGDRYLHSVYPASQLTRHDRISSEHRVAVQGFGLSCIDAVMAMTEGRGGQFVDSPGSNGLEFPRNYSRSGAEPQGIYPYTLDGLVPVPKPATAELDSLYRVDGCSEELRPRLNQALRDMQSGESSSALIEVFAELAGRVADRHPQFDQDTSTSAFANCFPSPSDHDGTPALQRLQRYRDMAYGFRPPSAEYLAGQVWRHVQRDLYDATAEVASPEDEELVSTVLELDEGMKRLTYGPPAYQVAKLIALVEASVLSVDYLDGLEVEMRPGHVALVTDDCEAKCDYFINSVLSGTAPSSLKSPILKTLTREGHIIARGDLGFTSTKDNLHLHGRIHFDEVVGADSIHSAMDAPALCVM